VGKAGAGLRRSPKHTAGLPCHLPGTTEPSLAGPATHIPNARHRPAEPCSRHRHTGVPRTQLQTSLSTTVPGQRDASDPLVGTTLGAGSVAVSLAVANKKCGSCCLNLFALARTRSDVLAMLGIPDSKHFLKPSQVFVETLSRNSLSLSREAGQKWRRAGRLQLPQSSPPDQQGLPWKRSQRNPERSLA